MTLDHFNTINGCFFNVWLETLCVTGVVVYSLVNALNFTRL